MGAAEIRLLVGQVEHLGHITDALMSDKRGRRRCRRVVLAALLEEPRDWPNRLQGAEVDRIVELELKDVSTSQYRKTYYVLVGEGPI